MSVPDAASGAARRVLRGSAGRDGGVLILGYFTQVYGAVVSIAFAPFILRAIGADAYGLVGIFLIVQAWFQLIDAGMTPAMTREAARHRGGALDAATLSLTVRGLEAIVLATALPLVLGALWLSGIAARDWIAPQNLPVSDVANAFRIMVLILLIRWQSGIRRGLLVGFEMHRRIYAVTLVVSTLRFPGIVLFFALVEPGSTAYFLYQLGIGLAEASVLWYFSRALVRSPKRHTALHAVRSLRRIASFAFTHGALAVVWIMIVQADKMMLSRALPLAEFGYFTLAVAAAAGVNLVVLPLGQMLKPRLARLSSQGEIDDLHRTYRVATRVAMVSLSGIVTLFLCFGFELMLAWTGDVGIARAGAPVVAFYALGNLAMALGSFVYYLQYAAGDLRLHTIGTVGKLVVILPAMYVAAAAGGLHGVALTWAGFWILHLLTWIPYTHRTFLPGQGWAWLRDDVLRIFLPVLLLGLVARRAFAWPSDRLDIVMACAGLFAALSLVALLCSGLTGRLRGSPKVGR